MILLGKVIYIKWQSNIYYFSGEDNMAVLAIFISKKMNTLS